MAYGTVFAGQTAATGAELDGNFNQAGLLGTIPCQVVGTNALTLTPQTFPTAGTPPIALQPLLRFSGIAVATNTTSVVANCGGSGNLIVYKDTVSGPATLSGGEIVIGNYFTLSYDASLSGGSGGFHLGSATTSAAGSVTNVATGAGLTGGPISTTGTIALAAIANLRVMANVSGGSAAPAADTLTSVIDNCIGSTQGDVLYRGASVWSVLPPGTSGQFLQTKGAAANPVWAAASSGTVVQADPSNPVGTGSLGGVMMGLSISVTPSLTGRLMAVLSGDIANTTGSDGGSVTMRFGTGAAPTNGGSLVGTPVGGTQRAIAGTVTIPFSVNAVIPNLAVGTAYWIDAAVAAITGGTVSIADLSASLIEI